jgi:hypothetical protein
MAGMVAGVGLVFTAYLASAHFLVPLGRAQINLATIVGIPSWVAASLLIQQHYFKGQAEKGHLLFLGGVSLGYGSLIFSYTHSPLLVVGVTLFLLGELSLLSAQYYVLHLMQKVKERILCPGF